MIGHELGGRYHILEQVGGGGMALVYKAHDILLNRNVAIKVLRQQFVNDEEFIRRFRREAQSAASLSHSNIVSVYDVGQEDEIHYIVMEYIEGQNLNEIIKERAPMQVEEAVRIASQIADALDHAHHNDIIHRDIKPHNILIGRNGRVKVTDFGIARAVTSSTITQTGSVVGSVHYFSPEHAKGVATGEKSDLYSLGIVLYQMLTGRLPFLGESPISVALKHLQEQFEEPRVVNPLIPQSVENIILKSMRKNPGERYNSAREMLRDLETCLLPERRIEPKLFFEQESDEDSTRVVPAIKSQSSVYTGPPSKLSRDVPNGEEFESKKDKKANKNKAILWVSLTAILLVAIISVAWYVNKVLTVAEVPIPNVVNLEEKAAILKLSESGLKVGEIVREYKDGFDEGIVYEQDKPEGTLVKEGSTVDLKVSTAKPTAKMISVVGETYDDAVNKLVGLEIDKSNISKTEQASDEVEEGKVIEQTPSPDSEFDPQLVKVVLIVSKGKENVNMINLIGMTQEKAEAELKELNLKLSKDGIKYEPSFDKKEGQVIDQWPFKAGDPVTPGSEVILTVSSGYPPSAFEYKFSFPVAPATEGKKSKIKITFDDARGEKQDWGTKTISSVETLSVDMILAPNKNGVVTVTRDGQYLDSYPVSYIDAKQGTVPIPQIPGTETPPDSGGDSPSNNEEPPANTNGN